MIAPRLADCREMMPPRPRRLHEGRCRRASASAHSHAAAEIEHAASPISGPPCCFAQDFGAHYKILMRFEYFWPP